MVKSSVIFGIPGQDSWFLAKLLLERGDEVIGCHRQSYTTSFPDFQELGPIKFRSCDLNDQKAVADLVRELRPDEIYNLAAHSFVGESFQRPAQIVSNNIISHINLLEAVRLNSPASKIYYAGSSEELDIESPYGVSKNAVRHLNDIYRRNYGLFIVHAQNFNHSSWRHSPKFLFGKVTRYVANLKRWLDKYKPISLEGNAIEGVSRFAGRVVEYSILPKLELGFLGNYKDINYAGDIIQAAVLLMSQKKSCTIPVASGVLTKIEDVVRYAFESQQLHWKDYVIQNESLFRVAESRIIQEEECLFLRSLGWKPSMTCQQLIKDTIQEYLDRGIT